LSVRDEFCMKKAGSRASNSNQMVNQNFNMQKGVVRCYTIIKAAARVLSEAEVRFLTVLRS